MLGFAIGFATIGGTQGGIGLLGVFGVVAIVWSIIGYYTGDKMVLAVSGARRVTHAEEPQLFNVVEEMTIAAGLPQVPAVYVIDEAAPNAFATGRDPQHASIAVTRGLLDRLDREQLQGVIAHEMSHIRNYDIRFETLVGILVGMIALIADFFLRWSFWGGMGGRRRGSDSGGDQASAIFAIVAIVLAILAPLAAYAVQFAISRRREYLADASAVELTRNPLGLARALNDIAADPQAAAPRQPRHGAPLHREPAEEDEGGHRRLRHAPADPAAHRGAARDGARRARGAGGGAAPGGRRPARPVTPAPPAAGGPWVPPPGPPAIAGTPAESTAPPAELQSTPSSAGGRSRRSGGGRGPAAGGPAPLPRAPAPAASARGRSGRSRCRARRPRPRANSAAARS